MLLCSATMNKISIFYCSMMIHLKSPYKSSKDFPSDIGLDNPIIQLPIIDPLPIKFFTAIAWGKIGRDGIDVNIEFSTNWIKFVSP